VGQYEEALQYFDYCLDIAQQIGSPRRAAFAQAGIGDTYLAGRAYDQALVAYQGSAEFAREAGIQSLEIYNLVKQGECYYGRQELSQALSLATLAREIATEAELTYEVGLACALQGRIHIRQGEYETGNQLCLTALTRFTQNDPLEQMKVRLWLGYSDLLNLKSSSALAQLREAIRLNLAMGEGLAGIEPTVKEVQRLLYHFMYWPDSANSFRNSIALLMERYHLDKHQVPKPNLQIFAFGTPMLIIADTRKQFNQRGGIRRTPELLLYLILAGRHGGCRWGEVCAALWPEEEADKASILFHQHLKRLRKAILGESDAIIVQDDYYQVNPEFLSWCDALAFDAIYEEAAKLTPDEALPRWLELIDLYRGEFLAGFELGEWGTNARTVYEDQFLQTVELAGEQLLKHKLPREALVIVKKGLAQDYFRESLHRLALRAYGELGLYDDLATHYQEVHQIFLKEFRTSPERETSQLFEQLMKARLEVIK
jgi:DNA-binding SARP family transcriptional activator